MSTEHKHAVTSGDGHDAIEADVVPVPGPRLGGSGSWRRRRYGSTPLHDLPPWKVQALDRCFCVILKLRWIIMLCIGYNSTDKLPFVTMGSGSLAAMSVFEHGYKDDMTVRHS